MAIPIKLFDLYFILLIYIKLLFRSINDRYAYFHSKLRFKNRLITCKFEAVRFFTQSIVDNIVDFYALFTSKPVDKVQYRLKNN